MPKQYEDIKASYLKRGEPLKEAKRIAAMTYIKKGNTGTASSRAKSLHSDSPRRKLKFPSPKKG
jgi:hypothetical protein